MPPWPGRRWRSSKGPAERGGLQLGGQHGGHPAHGNGQPKFEEERAGHPAQGAQAFTGADVRRPHGKTMTAVSSITRGSRAGSPPLTA